MRQVTIEKTISSGGRVRNRAVKRVWTFKEGELVKFNTTDGVKLAVVTLDDHYKCYECVFSDFGDCPKFKSNSLQGACLLCNHHRYSDMDVYFKPLDSVLEAL